METISLNLYINEIPLVLYTKNVKDNIDIKTIVKEFTDQLNNVLTYGLYEDGKLEDAINEGRFNGFIK